MRKSIELNSSICDNKLMGRPKKFDREQVLNKAIPLFWVRGYADTSLQDLEKATGVNKSGLYSEFESKEDIFLACLRHYFENRGGKTVLSEDPPGWHNVERFLKYFQTCSWGCSGCFGVNSTRELAILPPQALEILAEYTVELKSLLLRNVQAEQTTMDAEGVTEVIWTFFLGFCLEQAVYAEQSILARKVEGLMRAIRLL